MLAAGEPPPPGTPHVARARAQRRHVARQRLPGPDPGGGLGGRSAGWSNGMEQQASSGVSEAGRATAGGAGAPATWGQLLRRYRRVAGLTQEELAERSGYSTDYISKLERDQRQPPLLTIDHLATVLGLGSQEREALRAGRQQRLTQAQPGSTPLAGRGRELAQIDRHL